MKILLSLTFLLSALGGKAWAKDSNALYIVPAPAEYINHSRFAVPIIKAYEGIYTKKISYIFPELLVGEKDRLITLERVDGSSTMWEGDEFVAQCVEKDIYFSCDMTIKKEVTQAFYFLNALIPMAHAKGNLFSHDLAKNHLQQLKDSGVVGAVDFVAFDFMIDSVFINEPGGVLVYRFK
jgi:hypothetical protein